MKTYVRDEIAVWLTNFSTRCKFVVRFMTWLFCPWGKSPHFRRAICTSQPVWKAWRKQTSVFLDKITPWFPIHPAWNVVFKLNQRFWLLNKCLTYIKCLHINMITILFMHCFSYIRRDPVQSHTWMTTTRIHVSSLYK
jgi:hypothetical protein